MKKQRYESAEIEENRGIIPIWFIIVIILLLVWGGFYLVKYWGGLGPGIGY